MVDGANGARGRLACKPHRESSRTGSTSAVVWSIKNMGKWETEQVQFSSVRLSGHKQRQQVLSIEC